MEYIQKEMEKKNKKLEEMDKRLKVYHSKEMKEIKDEEAFSKKNCQA